MIEALTGRQQRERDFYNRYAQQCDTRVNLDPITSPHHRPWNSYWHFYRLVRDQYKPGARLLDFGCGWGSNTIMFAKIGYQIDAFDISEGNLKVARSLANDYAVEDQIQFHVLSAEQLDFPDNTFDVVAGLDILHHVNITQALRECRRVLKPGGTAIFHEPLSNFLFDPLRNSGLVRKLFPNEESLDKHITRDERKLKDKDLQIIREVFPTCKIDRFRVLSRLGVLLPKSERFFSKVDLQLGRVPGYLCFSGTMVLTLKKEGESEMKFSSPQATRRTQL